MAKKNFKRGIERVFSPTTKISDFEDVKDFDEIETAGDASPSGGELPKAASKKEELTSYNIRFSKDLQKRMKLFCIENDGIDMKDIFIQGAIMYMERK